MVFISNIQELFLVVQPQETTGPETILVHLSSVLSSSSKIAETFALFTIALLMDAP